MSSKKSTRNRSHSRKRSKSRGRASSKGGSTRKRSTSRGKSHTRKSSKGKLKKSIVRRHYRGGAEVVSRLSQSINGNVDIVVAQDTFLIVSNYDDNSICYYSIEDDPNDGKTNYVFKAYLSKPSTLIVSNVAVQEVKDKETKVVRTFLFYFVGAKLVCLEVNLRHDREYINSGNSNDNLFIDYAKKNVSFKDIGDERKYIVFYKNPETNTHNLCYTTLNNGELKFSEIALIMNPSKFEIYSISMIRTLGRSDDLYSFCFISNNLMAFLISNQKSEIDLPEIKTDELIKYTDKGNKNSYTLITQEDIRFIKISNSRYFTSLKTYKLMYYQYNYNTGSSSLLGGAKTSYVAFSPNYVRYSEIQGTDSTEQKSRGMVYNDNHIYINFNNMISIFRIPPECVFNHYLTMKKLGNRIETSGWKDFALHFDDRITFVQKAKDYNSKKNTEGKGDNKYKQAVRDQVSPFITKIENEKEEKGRTGILEKLKYRKAKEDEEKKQEEQRIQKKIENEENEKKEKERRAEEKRLNQEKEKKEKERIAEEKRLKQEKDEIARKNQEAKEAEARRIQQEQDETSFKSKSWMSSFKNPFKGGDELDDEAKRLYDKSSVPLFGKKKSIEELINTYEPTEVEIRIEELREQAIKGRKLVNDKEAQDRLAKSIMNRYSDIKMDGPVDYNEVNYKKYATKHENDKIENYDYDFLYFDKTDISVQNAMGLTLYDGKLLTVTGTNSITAVSL